MSLYAALIASSYYYYNTQKLETLTHGNDLRLTWAAEPAQKPSRSRTVLCRFVHCTLNFQKLRVGLH